MTDPPLEAAEHRVVLDTNVLVSALLTGSGNPNTLLRAVLSGQVTPVYSANIMAEYRAVLARPRFGFDTRDIADLLAFIEAFGEPTNPTPSDVPLLDESDRPFLDAGQATGAVVVTGNTKHFPRSHQLMTPADYVRSRHNST